MPSFFSNKKLIVLLTSLIVLVVLISFSLNQDRKSTWPEQFVRDTTGWFQYLLQRPAQYAAGFFGNVHDMANAYQENKQLKENLANYARVAQENRDLTHKYNELRKQLDLQNDADLSEYQKHTAMVIARSYDRWNQIVTVDKGENDGIQSGMPVITPKGLIGKIGKVGKFTSEVSLISDSRNVNQISAIIQDTRTYGMIEGYDEKKGVLLFQKIPIKSKVKKGQMVTTSGYTGKFPSGLPIGKVTAVSTDQYGLTKSAELKPAVDLNDLTYVIIVDRKARTSDTGGEGQ
ncbi:rod shape-determining protein MreC [Sporolactobacillus sp. THM7-7]|nr:rod shape-determining protein MreC [Sporolactobacillus sp. THM7-7]